MRLHKKNLFVAEVELFFQRTKMPNELWTCVCFLLHSLHFIMFGGFPSYSRCSIVS